MAIVTIGITGHINIMGQTRRLVAAAIATELGRVQEPFDGLTSLAPGADQVFAWSVCAAGGGIVFVQPSADIADTIPAANRSDFDAARSIARQTIALPHDHASEQAYFDAGVYIADHVDVLLAVWDGKPSGGLGGTGDIVQRRRATGRPLQIIWPTDAVRG